jgi:CubicO group peptidase (beta-lactamase class C family)
MSRKQIPHIILMVQWCVSLFACQSQGTETQGEPFELAPKPEINEDAVVEIGSIDPQIDEQLQSLVEEGGIPSLAVSLVVNDELVWARGYGEQPDLSTVYMIGSIDKAFIGTAVMQLYEQGMIELEADVNDYLPFNVRHPDYPNKPVTIEMLLTHKSGLAHDFPDGFYFENDQDMLEWASKNLDIDLNDLPPDPREKYSRDEYLRSYFAEDLPEKSSDIWVGMPGNSLQYSNIGFHWLLGYIVEQVSGQSIDTYVHENIIAPLGMENASYNAADFQDDHLATPYVRFEDGYQAMPHTGMSATGKLRTTITDLAKFMRAHMNQGESDGVRILQPESVDLMHARHLPMSGTDFPGMKLSGSGYGWWLWDDGLQGHGGAVPGFFAQILFKKTEIGAYGVVMMMNTGCSLVPCDMEWFDDYYITIRELLLQEAAEIYSQSAAN